MTVADGIERFGFMVRPRAFSGHGAALPRRARAARPWRRPVRETLRGTSSRACSASRITAPAGSVAARATLTPKRADSSRARHERQELDGLGQLAAAEARAVEAAEGARAAADREARRRRSAARTVEVRVDLGARLGDRGGAGRVVGEQPARQAQRAEVDRAEPVRPVAARAGDDLRRAAADIDDGDPLASR